MRRAMPLVSQIIVMLLATLICAVAEPAMPVTEFYCERPAYRQHADMARYVVHRNSWGSVASFSQHLQGFPFSNVVSYSDGALGNSTGRLIFYLTALDATGADVQANSHVTLSLAEAQIPGACPHIDPEDPTCAKVAISGKMLPVPAEELDKAEQLLFSRHRAMKAWPVGHDFVVYELQIMTVQLLDFYGGAANLSPQEYFAAKVSCSQSLLRS